MHWECAESIEIQYKYFCTKTNEMHQYLKFISFCNSILPGTLLLAQLVEALRYKPEGRGFDSRWCH
jgi:hypothetical protein